jgi:hypothetical protein
MNMGTAPWGPHGPQVPANTVTPNPTAQSGPGAQIGAGEGTFTPSQYTGGSNIGIIVVNILFSLILLAYLWEVFVCLYPLTAFTGILLSFIVTPIVAHADPTDLNFARAVGILSTIIAAYIMIRVEYRLAQMASYRLVRHPLRLLLLGILAIPVLMMIEGAYVPGSQAMFILSVLSNPARMIRFAFVPMNAAILLAFVVAAHFILWNWRWAREFWHKRLRWVGMK